jgi:peptide chain release factor 1
MIDESYIKNINNRLTELEGMLADPAIAANRKEFTKLLTEHAHQKKLQSKTSEFFSLVKSRQESQDLLADTETDADLREMAELEIAEIEEKLPDVEREMQLALIPPDPLDNSNVIIEIRAGTGGDEAALFAGDLFRMYSRFAETQGWKAATLDASNSEAGGFKEIIFSVEGTDVFKRIKYESGVHRVQRVPETEASGRIHTSAATVAVLAESEEVEDIELRPDEIKEETYRAQGPGGQSVNTTDSAVRITHIPTGIVAQCQDEKSQHKNRAKARRVLKARILDKIKQEEQAKQASERRAQIGSGDRSERIRTYNFPQNRVSDHRINLTLYSLDKVMEGMIEELITPLYENDMAIRAKAELEQ